MKYDSLNHRQRNKLQRLYEEKYPKPEEVEKLEYADPNIEAAQVIRANGNIRIFAEPSSVIQAPKEFSAHNRFHGNSLSECQLRLTIVQGQDTQTLEIDTDSLGQLIEELTRLREGIVDINASRLAHLQEDKRRRDAIESWTKQREDHLEARMNKHQPTEKALDAAETLADLWLS